MARPRRTSSNVLSAELRGDTGAPAVSTLEHKVSLQSPPLSLRKAAGPALTRAAKRRKARSLLRRWRNLSFKHTWVNPLVVILAILLLYAINPTPANPLHKALFLSYPLPTNDPLIPTWARDDTHAPTYYGKGKADFAFVAFYVVVLSFTRELLMQRLLRPLAWKCGLRSRSRQSRFMEQMYTAIYFSVFGPFGLYVMSRTPVWYFNTAGMYESFPHRSHDALFKAYYLLQASYWAQQAIVLLLQLEKPRKDFRELVAHHILTLVLIFLSYRFHFTYMGIAVYVTHDISDLFLATSLTLSYIKSPIVQPYFFFFTVVWVYLRHYMNLRILYSITTEFKTVGPFELDFETQQYKCWISQYITFPLLAMLQALNLFWLFLIMRITYNVVFKDVKRDVRSDEEEEEGSIGENEAVQEVPAANGRARKPAAVSSGVGIVRREALHAKPPANGCIDDQ
ncbi:MAG: hypothetical protein Q9161_003506 [Pseudevernia consocians]